MRTLSTKDITVRVIGPCEWCGCRLEIGESVKRTTVVNDDDEISAYRVHQECDEAMIACRCLNEEGEFTPFEAPFASCQCMKEKEE